MSVGLFLLPATTLDYLDPDFGGYQGESFGKFDPVQPLDGSEAIGEFSALIADHTSRLWVVVKDSETILSAALRTRPMLCVIVDRRDANLRDQVIPSSRSCVSYIFQLIAFDHRPQSIFFSVTSVFQNYRAPPVYFLACPASIILSLIEIEPSRGKTVAR